MNDQQAAWFGESFSQIQANVEHVIRGKSDAVRLALVALFAEGHLLIDDVPGTGKTSLAKAIAGSIQGTWHRIQFTPDLLPSDVTGVMIYNQGNYKFEFHAGPVFSNVVLTDEINRASPKTQSALLEVMEERQVTIDAQAYPVPRPFVVIATQNPVEHDGTYRLPEAQLDRFLMRMSIGYLDKRYELEVLASGGVVTSMADLQPVTSPSQVKAMIDLARSVHAADPLQDYIVRLAQETRAMPQLRLGVSTRGALAVLSAARVLAAADGRPFVKVDDIKHVAPAVLNHRLLLTPEEELRGTSAAGLVHRVMETVEPPPSERVAP
jgi:MoxR-like ATPase